MKTRIVLLLLLICSNRAISAQDICDDLILSVKRISLKGDDWEADKGHRSVSFIPIVATLENAIISIDFLELMGDVTVTISNNGHIIYTSSVPGDSSKKYFIPVCTYAPGIYLLEFSNPSGGSVSGWFELQ